MNRVILLFVIYLSFLIYGTSFVYAANRGVEQKMHDNEVKVLRINLPNPGIKADSVFHFIDNLLKKVRLFFTFNKEKRVELALIYAQEKLAEIKRGLNNNKSPEIIKRSIIAYQDYLSIAKNNLTNLSDKAQTAENFTNAFKEALESGKNVFENISENTPLEIKSVLNDSWLLGKQKLEEGMLQVNYQR